MDKQMSQKEVKRVQVLDLLKEGKISQKEASKRMGITPRQVRRLAKRYQAYGLVALISKKRGRASNRRLDDATRTTAVELIAAHYRDFGPTLAHEKLTELHNLHLSVESTRQIMIGTGYWHPKKGNTACTHPMRERRPRFGELIQIDGSPHDWFEACPELVEGDAARLAPCWCSLTMPPAAEGSLRSSGEPVGVLLAGAS